MKKEDYNNYKVGLEMGAKWEKALTGFAKKIGFGISRNDREKYGRADFEARIVFDFKHHGTAFRKSLELVGIPPEETIAIDAHKVKEYAEQNALVVMYVDYRPDFPTHGLFVISSYKAMRLMKEFPNRLFKLKIREGVSHQSKETFHISTKECLKFPMEFFEGIRKEAGE